MSRFVLDDNLDVKKVVPGLGRRFSVVRLQSLRPEQRIADQRVPELLLGLRRPTFLTIDHGFWDAEFCHPGYCILYFLLAKDQQGQLPALLRRLLRLPEFRTRNARMGKVARVQLSGVIYWEGREKKALELPARPQ